ncbi:MULTISPECIES: hypothetical protein [Lactobacillaceae]|uniref:hypothetical protein n=1 Tax=Lactobacillaceae TaxID=33958 RepID=UPI000F7DADD6|nr:MULTISPECIES: hypothetical protein [Lactobacillaceae]
MKINRALTVMASGLIIASSTVLDFVALPGTQEIQVVQAATKYPTAWTKVKDFSTVRSRNFKSITTSAIGTALGTLITGGTALAAGGVGVISGIVAAMNNGDDLIVKTNFYYRQLAADTKRASGDPLRHYEMRKEVSVFKTHNGKTTQIGKTRVATKKTSGIYTF